MLRRTAAPYDGCMLMLHEDGDWECETRLPAMGG